MQKTIRAALVAITLTTPAHADEIWTCIFVLKEPTNAAQKAKPERVYVSGDQLWPTWLTRPFKVVENNSDHILAFGFYKVESTVWVTNSIILERGSGLITDISEASGDNEPFIFNHNCTRDK
jgi:hypothetical protein